MLLRMTVSDSIPSGISNEIQIYSKEMFPPAWNKLRRFTSSSVARPFNSYFASGPNGITLRNYASMFSRNFIVLGWCAKWPTLITGLCAFKCIPFPSPATRSREPFARKDHFSDWWHYYAACNPSFAIGSISSEGGMKKERKKERKKKKWPVSRFRTFLKLNDRSLSRRN